MRRAAWTLQFLGLAFLVVVVLTHVGERFHIFPGMSWGLPNSAGHYLDLASAILGCSLVAPGLLAMIARRSKPSN
jgi:hypothetical protein